MPPEKGSRRGWETEWKPWPGEYSMRGFLKELEKTSQMSCERDNIGVIKMRQ